MTKKDVIEKVAFNLGLPRKDAKEIVNMTFQVMSEALIAGENLNISDFATFKIMGRVSRKNTGETEGKRIKVKMSEVIRREIDPAFRPSKRRPGDWVEQHSVPSTAPEQEEMLGVEESWDDSWHSEDEWLWEESEASHTPA